MPEEIPELPIASPLVEAGRHCATLARFKYRAESGRGFIPHADEPTSPVTFVGFEGRTYAVTAAHVVHSGPRFHVLCQRVDHATMDEWARGIDER